MVATYSYKRLKNSIPSNIINLNGVGSLGREKFRYCSNLERQSIEELVLILNKAPLRMALEVFDTDETNLFRLMLDAGAKRTKVVE
jgi:hypothetical protein